MSQNPNCFSYFLAAVCKFEDIPVVTTFDEEEVGDVLLVPHFLKIDPLITAMISKLFKFEYTLSKFISEYFSMAHLPQYFSLCLY